MRGVRIPSCFMTTTDTIGALALAVAIVAAVAAVGSWKAARDSSDASRLCLGSSSSPPRHHRNPRSGLTTRGSGCSSPQIAVRQQRQQPDALGREGIGAALLTVNHAQSLKHPGPQTAQVRRRQDDLSAAGDHIQADRFTLVDNPSTRSFTCSRTPPTRQLAARSPKLKPLSQALHIVIRRRFPRKRAGQSKMAQLTASIRAAPVWCA